MRNRKVFTLIALVLGVSSGCDDGDEKAAVSGRSDSALCARICARSEAARCSNDRDDCSETCGELIDETPDGCASELDAFTRCAEKATFTCDRDGESEAKSCAKQLAAWGRCVGAEGGDEGTGSAPTGTRPDAGTSSPSTPATPNAGRDAGLAMCAEEADDTACTSCVKDSCCGELSACGTECQRLYACVAECATPACAEACARAASPSAAQAFVALATCQTNSCTAACSGDASSVEVPTADAGTPGAPGDCLPRGSVPAGHCNVAGKPNAYECVKPPFPGCVPSPTGVSDIYCCSQ